MYFHLIMFGQSRFLSSNGCTIVYMIWFLPDGIIVKNVESVKYHGCDKEFMLDVYN